MTAAELCERLAAEATPGAIPTDEFDSAPGIRLPLAESWDNLASMRHWAAETLSNVTVCAVDGSQLPATKDFPLPVAAVQVAWFINPHSPDWHLRERMLHVEVLTPRDLGDDDVSDANIWISLRRYELEVARINTFMREFAGRWRTGTLALFDGSLARSPIRQAGRKEVRDRYRSAAVSMLRTSVECQDASHRLH